MAKTFIKVPDENNLPKAYIRDGEKIGRDSYEIQWDGSQNETHSMGTLLFSSGKQFVDCINALNIPGNRIFDKRTERNKEIRQSHIPTHVNTYLKAVEVKAIQLQVSKNLRDVGKFISDNGGEYMIDGKKLYIYSFTEKNESPNTPQDFRRNPNDRGRDYLRDQDFVICQHPGDVYPCPKDHMLTAYSVMPGQSDDSREARVYIKTQSVTAIQFSLTKNQAEVQTFIESNGGECTFTGSKFLIYLSGGGHDFVEDGDYVISQGTGKVNGCKKGAFLTSYDYVPP